MGCGVYFLTIFGRFEALNALKMAQIDGKCVVRAVSFFIHKTGVSANKLALCTGSLTINIGPKQ